MARLRSDVAILDRNNEMPRTDRSAPGHFLVLVCGLLAGEVTGRGHALEANAVVGSVAEGALFAGATTTEGDGGLAGEIPFSAVGVDEADVAFHAERAVGADGDGNWGLFGHGWFSFMLVCGHGISMAPRVQMPWAA